MTKAALIIIYNHRFEENIDALERIYGKRFSSIFHLIPFYTGDRPNVIPVYDNSYYFQGFIAQALRSFFREDFTHYFFIADDMILNPRIDEKNLITELPLPEGYSFISTFSNYNANRKNGFWTRVEMAYQWKLHQNGLNAARELPTREAALEIFTALHLPTGPLKFEQIWRIPHTAKEWLLAVFKNPLICFRYLCAKATKRQFHLSYPLTGSYSDIFIIPSEHIKKFSHYCGVFAAGNLFVEHAIPTALVLTTNKIVTCGDRKLRGKALWSPDDFKEFEPFEMSLFRLLRNFPPSYLFLHPVKLSQWKRDLDLTAEETLANHLILSHTGYRNQIRDLRISGGDLCFTATGLDPYLFLPKVNLAPDRTTWMSLDITVPGHTAVQLFPQTLENENFSEELSRTSSVPPGRHKLEWTLPERLNGSFRLDPGNIGGEYRIHQISFRQ